MGPAQPGLPPPATQSGPPESYAPLPVLAFGASSMTACVLMLRVQRGPKNGRKFTRLIRIWKNERKKGSPKLAPRSLAYNERGPDTFSFQVAAAAYPPRRTFSDSPKTQGKRHRPPPHPHGPERGAQGTGSCGQGSVLVWTLRTQQRAPGGHSAALGGQGGELEPG